LSYGDKPVDCRYSNDGFTWTDFEPAVQAKQWVLSYGDGVKTVYVGCRDNSGRMRQSQDSIILDAKPPVVGLLSPSGTVSSEFEASFWVTDEQDYALDCFIHLDSLNIEVGGVANNSIKTKTLTASPGTHSLSVECVDGAENLGRAEASFTVQAPTPNPRAPTGLTIKINGGASATASRNVKLNVYAANATECRYSNDGVYFTPWSDYTTEKDWWLSEGYGVKRVYYYCRNAYGSSNTVYDDITYEQPTGAPYGLSVSINGGAAFTNNVSVTLYLSAVNALECRYSSDGSSYTQWESYVTTQHWTLQSGDGSKTVYYQCRNSYASVSPVTDSIVLDQTKPSRVDDLKTNSAQPVNGVGLEWSASTDYGGSGVNHYNVYRSVDGAGFQKIAETVETAYSDKLLDSQSGNPRAPHSMQYYVTASDYAGNEGEQGNIVTIQV